MVSLAFLLWTFGLQAPYNHTIYPGSKTINAELLAHPSDGKSIVYVQVDKVEGQSIDLKIFCGADFFLPRYQGECYSQKNIPPLKKIFIALDNNDQGFFVVNFVIVPKPGFTPKEVGFFCGIITDTDEVNKIINSIFDAGT